MSWTRKIIEKYHTIPTCEELFLKFGSNHLKKVFLVNDLFLCFLGNILKLTENHNCTLMDPEFLWLALFWCSFHPEYYLFTFVTFLGLKQEAPVQLRLPWTKIKKLDNQQTFLHAKNCYAILRENMLPLLRVCTVWFTSFSFS